MSSSGWAGARGSGEGPSGRGSDLRRARSDDAMVVAAMGEDEVEIPHNAGMTPRADSDTGLDYDNDLDGVYRGPGSDFTGVEGHFPPPP